MLVQPITPPPHLNISSLVLPRLCTGLQVIVAGKMAINHCIAAADQILGQEPAEFLLLLPALQQLPTCVYYTLYDI